MQPEPHPATDSNTATRLLILLAIILAATSLLFSARFRVDDEHILAARAQSLALWGELEAPQVFGNQRQQQLLAWGDPATQIEPFATVIGAAFYRAGVRLGWGGGQALFTTGIYATAASALLIFIALRAIGIRESASLWTIALFGLSSSALVYSTTLYRDTIAMLMISLTAAGWALLVGRSDKLRRLGGIAVVAGISLGVLTKNTSLVALPAYSVGLLILTFGSRWSRRTRIFVWGLVGLVLAGILIAIALLPSAGPLARFSSGYYASLMEHFRNSISLELVGAVLGPFFSPTKSIFLFSLPLFLLIPALASQRRLAPALAVPFVLIPLLLALSQGLFYRESWAGGFGWGLRFMQPALPGLFIVLAPAVEYLADRETSLFQRLLLPFLSVVGLVVQLSGALVPWTVPFSQWRARGLDPYVPGAAWDPQFFQIPPQFSAFTDPGQWDLTSLRLMRAGGGSGWLLILLPILIALLAVMAHKASRAKPVLAQRLAVAACAAGVMFPFFPMLALAQGDPGLEDDRQDLREAVEYVQDQATAADLILIDSYTGPLWTYAMNRWDSSLRWYSLPYRDRALVIEQTVPDEAVIILLEAQLDANGRAWVLTQCETDKDSVTPEITWLETRSAKPERWRFNGSECTDLIGVFPRLDPETTNPSSVN